MMLLLFGSTAPYVLVKDFIPNAEAKSPQISGEVKSLSIQVSSIQKPPQVA